MFKSVLVTGSSGLIGSEVCSFFSQHDFFVHGIDNNMRAFFFGPQGDTRWNQKRLQQNLTNFRHHEIDIRERDKVLKLITNLRPDVIVHAAAQPSHDHAAAIPFDDFDINATGTLNLLEAVRRSCPESPFIHMSSNKVYGDSPNCIPLVELDTRWDFGDPAFAHGIPETYPIDHSTHSLFGASKVAADILVQEYGRYFNMPTCCLRGGCLTGTDHSSVELHGFLSYLVRCNVEQKEYRIYGYKGKQVRDNIHSRDVARFIKAFADNPKSGEVYNLGGGRENSCSIIEAFKLVEKFTGNEQIYTYIEKNRIGDHICYYSDLTKVRSHYPNWDISVGLEETVREIAENWKIRSRRT